MPDSILPPWPKPSPLQRLDLPLARKAGVRLFCKRDDLFAFTPLSPLQGNKMRKLKPLIERLRRPDHGILRIVTFGGNRSNHTAAVSVLGDLFGIPVTVFIRGDEVRNSVINFIRSVGGEVDFLSYSDYRKRGQALYQEELVNKLEVRDGMKPGEVVVIPEGGTTKSAVIACKYITQEIIDQLGEAPDIIAVSMGTGGTAAGIISHNDEVEVEVFSAIKGKWIHGVIDEWLSGVGVARTKYSIIENYIFGAYGKYPEKWRTPNEGVATLANIGIAGLPPLEAVYSAKLFSGVIDRIAKGIYPRGSSVVIYHGGGIY